VTQSASTLLPVTTPDARRTPLVSIVMPVHNAERHLAHALDSALRQTYRPIEIIAVDDGSTDRSAEILAQYVASHAAQVTYLHQKNMGAAAARNAALAAARGEYIAFLDADDLWAPNKLEVQIAYLESRPDVQLVASRWRVLSSEQEAELFDAPASLDDLDRDNPGRINQAWIYNELLIDCVVHTTTAVMRRGLMQQIGSFDTALRRGQDYDYWLRASRVTPIPRLEAQLSAYRLHATNSSWRPQPVNYAAVVIQRALHKWGRKGPDGRVTSMSTMRRRLADHWFNFGYQHALRGSLRTALGSALRSLAFWPFQVRAVRLIGLCMFTAVRRVVRPGAQEQMVP
jgi:glycosyltransferase involved in cell wall biosynthesis